MAITLKVVETLDELVERADYGVRADDERLANAVSEHWTEIEPILRSAATAAPRKRAVAGRRR